jgi:hypothetical protein
MLENYLRCGVRLKWMPPSSRTSVVNDGAVIPTPPVPLNQMVYDGMDDQIMANFHSSALGLRVGQSIPYRWLTYVSGRTTTMPLAGGDVLTGPMSGCLIATWTDGSAKIAHVGTIDNNVPASTTVKRTFAAEAGAAADLSAFNPAALWNPGQISAAMGTRAMSFQIYALVAGAGAGNYYSVLIFELPIGPGNNVAGRSFQRVVGGIKQAPRMAGVQLRAFLLS